MCQGIVVTQTATRAGLTRITEVWEPTPQEQALTSYQQKIRTDQGSDYSDSVLSFSFKKKKPKENWVMRILYYDNLRVIGRLAWTTRALGSLSHHRLEASLREAAPPC